MNFLTSNFCSTHFTWAPEQTKKTAKLCESFRFLRDDASLRSWPPYFLTLKWLLLGIQYVSTSKHFLLSLCCCTLYTVHCTVSENHTNLPFSQICAVYCLPRGQIESIKIQSAETTVPTSPGSDTRRVNLPGIANPAFLKTFAQAFKGTVSQNWMWMWMCIFN